jgi:hypothetical protein
MTLEIGNAAAAEEPSLVVKQIPPGRRISFAGA